MVIAYISFFDNNLKMASIIGPDNMTWKQAYIKACEYWKDPIEEMHEQEWVDEMPEDLDEAKQWFFDCDSAINVITINNAPVAEWQTR